MKITKNKLVTPLVREFIFLDRNIKYFESRVFNLHKIQHVLKEPPSLLGLNTTGYCNAKCCYCAYPMHKPDGIMDMAIYEKAVTDFNSMGGGLIGLSTLTGEPLLDPYLIPRIEFAANLDNIAGIKIVTNGILFQREDIVTNLIRLASDVDISIYISMPGFEREMFERVFRVANYDKVLMGISSLLKANQENNNAMQIVLQLEADRGGVRQDQDFINMIMPYTNKANISTGLVFHLLRGDWCGQISQEQLTGDMLLHRPLKFKNYPCYEILKGDIDILVNGDARVCGCQYGKKGKYDCLVIGNIMKDRLSDIWFGDARAEICNQFIKGEVPEPCQVCLMYEPYVNSTNTSFLTTVYRRCSSILAATYS
jgi:MoaA/NifB/PqqE/SkfB family radical SAM enzyme